MRKKFNQHFQKPKEINLQEVLQVNLNKST